MKWFLKFSIAKSEGENTNFFRDTFFFRDNVCHYSYKQKFVKNFGPKST